MSDKLLIIGASGHGKVVADIALSMNKWSEIAFLDDNEEIKSSIGLNVIGTTKDVFKYIDEYDVFVAVGNNTIREKLQAKLEALNVTIPTLVHPEAVIGEEVKIGQGTVIMARVAINCCSQIGKGCIVNTGATIDHDNKIDDYVHVSPGVNIAGTVKIAKGTWIGIGSSIINNININNKCKIGAGAVVVKDINEEGTYVGVPARRI